jgi:hypothetical protein
MKIETITSDSACTSCTDIVLYTHIPAKQEIIVFIDDKIYIDMSSDSLIKYKYKMIHSFYYLNHDIKIYSKDDFKNGIFYIYKALNIFIFNRVFLKHKIIKCTFPITNEKIILKNAVGRESESFFRETKSVGPIRHKDDVRKQMIKRTKHNSNNILVHSKNKKYDDLLSAFDKLNL